MSWSLPVFIEFIVLVTVVVVTVVVIVITVTFVVIVIMVIVVVMVIVVMCMILLRSLITYSLFWSLLWYWRCAAAARLLPPLIRSSRASDPCNNSSPLKTHKNDVRHSSRVWQHI